MRINMKHTIFFLLIVTVISFCGFAMAASCEHCNKKIADDKQFCANCTQNTSGDLAKMKANEGRIASTIQTSRENYKNALEELVQHYLNIGNQSRLKQARKELKALNKVPQLRYLTASEETTKITPSKNIEDANILFQDGMAYKSPLSILKKKTNLSRSAARFRRILNKYPESDIADDAAYELADILEKSSFKNYEEAAFYYVKCYELNPNTEMPALYEAGRVYDKKLHDYAAAIKNYEMALKTGKNEEKRKEALSRLDNLKKQEFE
jgi:tetratricopeptide (TPR) repeat protein